MCVIHQMPKLAELLQQFTDKTTQHALCLHLNMCDITDVPDQQVNFIKAIFHSLIVDDNKNDLIPVYAKFWDNIYEGRPFDIFTIEIPSNIIESINKKYAEKLAEIERRRLAKNSTKYKAREIVLVRDKLNQWLLSRVLQSYAYDGHTVYYVEFLEYPDIDNEIIVDPLRIKKYYLPKNKQFVNQTTDEQKKN